MIQSKNPKKQKSKYPEDNIHGNSYSAISKKNKNFPSQGTKIQINNDLMIGKDDLGEQKKNLDI
ncbi:hypothetical protein DERF_012161 [Dermatophagoides farinae]|uniref:Uncharacterized protein n=1 Tax=Dermatophagoides farinae TaxID=6954 RepID=A0A922L1G2_DERFA|nr:hypothetical protein DERF_012161 [Dermatophagoides farinae]